MSAILTNVTTSTAGATGAQAGAIIIGGSTFKDTNTAASASTVFNGMYLPAVSLSAANTGVTTTTAATLTIAGAPTAGTNQTLTSALALNVASGNAAIAGALSVGGALTAANLPVAMPNPTLTFTNMSSNLTSVTSTRAYLTYDSGRQLYTLTVALVAVLGSAGGLASFSLSLPNRTNNFTNVNGLQLKGAPYAFNASLVNVFANVVSANAVTTASCSISANANDTVYLQFECLYPA
jgi:hypothetical protein